MIKENMNEYHYSDYEHYNKYNFAFRMFISWLLRLECPYCDWDGMTGYEEREACNECDGFHLQWNSLIKQKWINFWKEKGHDERGYFEFDIYYSQNTLEVDDS